jgi:hypothetical protein
VVVNFEKFQLCGLVTSDPFRGKIQKISLKNLKFITDSVKQIKKIWLSRKKPFVFAILSGKVGIFRCEQRKMLFSNSAMGNLQPFKFFGVALLKPLKYAYFIEKSTKYVEKVSNLALDLTF